VTHDLQRKESERHSHTIFTDKIMNNFYPSTDNRLNEARTLIQQMSNEELEKIRNSDDEAIKFVRNLSEVMC
jgi:phosphate uptake regulator